MIALSLAKMTSVLSSRPTCLSSSSNRPVFWSTGSILSADKSEL